MAKFSNEVIALAQETQEKYGVPASVTLAQYALESGYGTSKLATGSNNYFGISGSYNGQFTRSGGRTWRKYNSMAESFHDHGRLLSSGRYAEATAGATNVNDYIDSFAEIYAPSSDGNAGYSSKLKSIIATNNLTQYDTGNFVSSGITVTPVGWMGDKGNKILSGIVKIIVMVLLAFGAVIFFMQAFDVSMPKVSKGKGEKHDRPNDSGNGDE